MVEPAPLCFVFSDLAEGAVPGLRFVICSVLADIVDCVIDRLIEGDRSGPLWLPLAMLFVAGRAISGSSSLASLVKRPNCFLNAFSHGGRADDSNGSSYICMLVSRCISRIMVRSEGFIRDRTAGECDEDYICSKRRE